MDTKKWAKEDITKLLQENDKAVFRGVVAIFRLQTIDEQKIGDTRHHNKVGYTAAHARFMSYYAKWIQKNKKLDEPHLSKARKCILHYTRQLTEIANGVIK